MTVRWLRGATLSLRAAQSRLAVDDPQVARRLDRAVESAAARLGEFPTSGEAGMVPGTRQLVVRGLPCVVVYRVAGSEVQILRVFHARGRGEAPVTGARRRRGTPGGAPLTVPAVIADAGDHAARRFLEFFAANIRNRNTRVAYARAVAHFMDWCRQRQLALGGLSPLTVAAYVEELATTHAPPSVKQHLAAIRMLLDWLVVGQVLPMNPAASVRGPRHVVKKGKTVVLTARQARELLDSIDTSTLAGLRDRALIGVMVYSFARVSAVVNMDVQDYWRNGKRWWLRLHEKGGKHHEVPAHHNAEAYLDAWVAAAGLAGQGRTPLFRSMGGRGGVPSVSRLSRKDALRMVKRRAAKAGLPARVCCHTFRATGITAYLQNGGTIEKAQAIAAHESPRTTKLYDRTGDEISLDEIERIII